VSVSLWSLSDLIFRSGFVFFSIASSFPEYLVQQPHPSEPKKRKGPLRPRHQQLLRIVDGTKAVRPVREVAFGQHGRRYMTFVSRLPEKRSPWSHRPGRTPVKVMPEEGRGSGEQIPMPVHFSGQLLQDWRRVSSVKDG
jgi:hypothetical protein